LPIGKWRRLDTRFTEGGDVGFGFQPIGASLGGILLENTGAFPTVTILFGFMLALALFTLASPTIRGATAIGGQEKVEKVEKVEISEAM
jgi:hypothetical protein